MTRQLSYLVLVDGGTDRALLPVLDWTIHRLDPTVEILEPDIRKRRGSLPEAVDAVQTGAMLTFVHRDAEGLRLAERLRDFQGVQRPDVVPVVPVRMTEAWLLIDGPAIARAADRPGQTVRLPAVAALERMADPKRHLEQLLLDAAGQPTGRARKKFVAGLDARRANVATLISDFSPLLHLEAFRCFEQALRERYPYPVG